VAGAEFFYEHVHLNFDGNYLLARTIAEQAEKMLPDRNSSSPASAPWPSEIECARRLGWNDHAHLEAVENIMSRLQNPPFTNQSDHEVRMQALLRLAQDLAPAGQPAGIRNAKAICHQALGAVLCDPELMFQLALLEARNGELTNACATLEKEVDALPSDVGGWGNLGLVLSEQRKFGQAIFAFQRAIALDPLDASLWQRTGYSFWKSDDPHAAIAPYTRALKIEPNTALVWMELGQVLDELKRKPEAADRYQRAISGQSKTLSEFVAPAHFCEARSWFHAASTNYLNAIRLDPADAKLHVDAGGDFALLGRNDEAEKQFRQALALEPDLAQKRVNLAVALMKEKRGEEALAELNIVLRQEPSNRLAIRYATLLRQNGITARSAR
jgi:tetratricopeptide (TPR) repeat protein